MTNECTTFKKEIQKEINENQLRFADQENKNMKIDQNPFPPHVNMVDIEGKASLKEKVDQDIANTKRSLWLCIRCKAKMTRHNWEAIIQEKLYEKWKEFMAFPEEWEDLLNERMVRMTIQKGIRMAPRTKWSLRRIRRLGDSKGIKRLLQSSN